MCDYNLNVLLCKDYDTKNIGGIFNKIILRQLDDKTNFNIVLLLNILGNFDEENKPINKNDIEKMLCVYLTIFNEKGAKFINITNIDISNDDSFDLTELKTFKSFIPGIKVNYVLEMKEFIFPAVGDYELVVFLLDSKDYEAIEQRTKGNKENKFEILLNEYKKCIKSTSNIEVQIENANS